MTVSLSVRRQYRLVERRAEHEVAERQRGRGGLADPHRVAREHDAGLFALLERQAVGHKTRRHPERDPPDEVLAGRHRRGRHEMAGRVERAGHPSQAIHGHEAHAHRVEVALGDGHRLEPGAGDRVGDLDLTPAGVPADGEHLGLDLELLGELELIAVGLGAERDAGLPYLALLVLEASRGDPAGRLQPPVDRGELLPGKKKLLRPSDRLPRRPARP